MKRENERHDSTPTDVGRTSGSGSLGHRQPREVNEEAPIRNQRDREEAEQEDPVMPSNDSSLNTKI